MFFFEVWRPYVFIIPNYRQSVLLHYTAIDLLAWSREGCKTLPGENSGTVRCECTHLTNFALLLDDNQSKTITTLSSLNQVGKLMLSSCLVRFKRRNPVEKKKLNLHKTFRRLPEGLLNVLCKCNLHHVPWRKLAKITFRKKIE